jgi:NADH-quinone oxidoreductase subunit A
VCEFESRRPHQTEVNEVALWQLDCFSQTNRLCCVDLTMNLDQYLPVLLFILVGVTVGVVPQVLGRLLGPVRPDAEKNSPYECGFEAFEDARMKFDVRYYLVAILFILFDLEIAFLFPWAVALKEIGAVGFWSVMAFLGILVVGFIYEWKKGALDWE